MSNGFVKIKMCYVYNQWYDISCATLCIYIVDKWSVFVTLKQAICTAL